MASICILIPVYNDWQSLLTLLSEIDRVMMNSKHAINIMVIDDGSPMPIPTSYNNLVFKHIQDIEIVRLSRNMGHQRAIAVGMVHVAREIEFDALIVMDSDGEDRPQDLPQLITEYLSQPDNIIVAGRNRRSEGMVFRLFYTIYKRLFALLTGVNIDFGNYSLIPQMYIDALIHDPNLWNHLAATIRRSKIPIAHLPTARGQRYSGQSSMNFTSLVLHGLSAISVYLDIAVVRILIFSLLIAVVAMLGIGVVVFLRVFTSLAIPGWATTAVGILSIILSQAVLFSAVGAIAILNQRSRLLIVPARHAEDLVTVQTIRHISRQ